MGEKHDADAIELERRPGRNTIARIKATPRACSRESHAKRDHLVRLANLLSLDLKPGKRHCIRVNRVPKVIETAEHRADPRPTSRELFGIDQCVNLDSASRVSPNNEDTPQP